MTRLLTATLLALALYVPCTTAASAIPVTETWVQLRAAPTLEIVTPSGPAKVRLGLEHSRSVAGRTIAIFALVEGPDLEPYDNGYNKQLGPLLIDAWPLGVAQDRVQMAQQKIAHAKQSRGEKKPFQLYALLLPLRVADRYAVRAHLPGGEALAEAELLGESGWSHPWTRLRFPAHNPNGQEREVAGEARAEAVYADWEVCYPRLDGTTPLKTMTAAELNAAAGLLPRADGMRRPLPLPDHVGADALKKDGTAITKLIAQLGDPDFEARERATAILHALLPDVVRELKAARFSTVDPEARTRLESLLEAGEAYTLKLNADRDGWTLEFAVPREFGRYYSVEKILTRWWINGKPIVKEAPATQNEQLMDVHERVDVARVWKIDLNADYAWLGARPGDSVSVQILYAPCGIKGFEEPVEEASLAIDCEGGILPLLSNISTFIYKKK